MNQKHLENSKYRTFLVTAAKPLQREVHCRLHEILDRNVLGSHRSIAMSWHVTGLGRFLRRSSSIKHGALQRNKQLSHHRAPKAMKCNYKGSLVLKSPLKMQLNHHTVQPTLLYCFDFLWCTTAQFTKLFCYRPTKQKQQRFVTQLPLVKVGTTLYASIDI